MADPFAHLQKFDMTSLAMSESLDGDKAWASDFTWPEIESLAAHTAPYKAKKGTVIVNEGDTERYMGIVLVGQLDVFKKATGGKDKPLAQITRGKTFGEMSHIDGEPRSASLIAAFDATLLIITHEHMTKLNDEAPRLGFKFLLKVSRLLSQRLRQTSGILADKISEQ